VLVPSYNQGQFLEECLRSLLGQNYPKLEILVADGGSQDQSKAIIDYYSPQLAWAISEKDKGTWDADNKALAQATGDYVLVVNSDDLLLKNGLYNLLKTLLASQEQHWATGRVRAINAAGETKAVFTPAPPAGAKPGLTFLELCWIFHPATLVRRSLIGQFMETDVMDWEVWIRLERDGLLPAICPCEVAGLRFHSDSKSYNSVAIYASNLALMDKIAHHYPDRLVADKRRWAQKEAEAEMVQLAEEGKKIAALTKWAGFGLQNIHLLGNRPYVGLGKRLLTGHLQDMYRPMAFLDQPYHPQPEDPACTS
jgi:glycosyltransferase involved in cell wall biosynthesis